MQVKQTGGRVWIDGVEGFTPREYVSSPHGCQARILQAVGESMGYDDLLIFSGFAFRIGIHEALCPSAGHPCCGFMCVEGSNQAFHYAEIATLCMKDLASPWDLALPPDRAQQWSMGLRQDQAARVDAARTIDRAAIDAVTRALTLLS